MSDKPSSNVTKFYEAAHALSMLPRSADGRDPENMVDELLTAFQAVIRDMSSLRLTYIHSDVFEKQIAAQVRNQTRLGKPQLRVIEGAH